MFKKIKINKLIKEYNELCWIISRNPTCREEIKAQRAELAEKIEKLRK